MKGISFGSVAFPFGKDFFSLVLRKLEEILGGICSRSGDAILDQLLHITLTLRCRQIASLQKLLCPCYNSHASKTHLEFGRSLLGNLDLDYKASRNIDHGNSKGENANKVQDVRLDVYKFHGKSHVTRCDGGVHHWSMRWAWSAEQMILVKWHSTVRSE